MLSFQEKYKQYQTEFESALVSYCNAMSYQPQVLRDSMCYSLLLGGKRIRPVIMLATADMLQIDRADVMPYALAIEMIHTYSLIHDDLPAMDNDDFRRGKPSNHKVYGEANAILAGDALLNEGLTLVLKQSIKGCSFAKAALYLSECAGAGGMIAGQSADLISEKETEHTEAELSFIDVHKTGKLLLAPLMIPAILCDYNDISILNRIGELLGKMFQWTDDILDIEGSFDKMGKTLGKDQQVNKLTCVSLYGLQGAKEKVAQAERECFDLLSSLPQDTSFLKDLVSFIRNRNQ